NLTYTVDPNDLNDDNLEVYDGLVLFSDLDSLSSDQIAAVENFVEDGSGLITLGVDPDDSPAWYREAIGRQAAADRVPDHATSDSARWFVKGNGRIFHTAYG